jgi:hypothetical protein
MINWKICVTCLSICLEEPQENNKKLVNMVSVPFTNQTVYFLITSVAEAKIWKCIAPVTSVEGGGNCFNIRSLVVYSWFLMILRKNTDFP